MNRNALVVVAGIVAAAAAAFFLLGGPSGIFGAGDGGRSESSSAPPDQLAGSGSEDGSSSAGAAKRAVLFGRKRADLKGVGGLRARVLHYGDNKPIAGVKLLLTGSGYGGESVAAEATSDANGRAAWNGIAAGDSFRLEVRAEREAPLFLPDVPIPARSTTELAAIYLGARGALVGRVVDERGEGVAAADVRVFGGRGGFSQILENFSDLFANLDRDPKPLAQATAARDGRFRIEDVAPGSVTVRATSPGRVRKMVQGEMTPQGLAGGEITIVLLGGAEVSGKVVDEAGQGVPGARLAVMSENASDPFEFIYGRVFADADAKGDFRVTVDPASKGHRAIVAAEGYPTTMSKRFEAGEADLKIVLHRGVTALVSVREKETGRPIEGAQVMIVVTDSKPGGDGDQGAMAFGVTDSSGTTSLPTRAGKLQMGMVTAPGHAAAMLSGVQGMPANNPMSADGDYPKELKAGVENRFDLRLTGGVTLAGRVLDPSGGPIADAELKPLSFFGGGAAAVRSGADGAYRLEGVPSNGLGFVRVRAAGWTQHSDDMNLKLEKGASGEIAHDFTLHRSATVKGRVVDATSLPVAGAKVSFSPADGSNFGLGMFLGDTSATTAADGTYVIYDVDQNSASGADMMMGVSRKVGGDSVEREPPKSTVRVKATGYVEGKSEGFLVPEGEIVDAPLVTLSHGSRITGVVVDPRGSPMPHARLEASFQPAGETQKGFDFESMMEGARTILAGDDGKFAIETVPVGTATLTVSADGVAATRKTVKVEGEAPPPAIEIRMRQALEIRGRVLDPDRRGVAGARVSVDQTGPDSGDDAYFEPVQARTDAEGQFVLKPLPPMRAKVSVSAAGFSHATEQLDVGGPPFDVHLVKRSTDSAKRITEIDAEVLEISKQFATVKDSAGRQALSQRMMELMREKQELQGDGANRSPEGGVGTDR